jgi:uncharacterized membrane protein
VSKLRTAFWVVFVALILGASLLPAAVGSLVSGFHFPGSRYYDLPSAEVNAAVRRDGAVRVTETITFSFHGVYSGAYRDIPLAPGQSVSDVSVGEAGVDYTPGASAVLGSFGIPGSFGTEQLPDRERIVWHYSAADEPRAFSLSYVLHGVLVVHPDVVDMNMNVWGDGWPSPLGTLLATVRLPRGVTPAHVWGNPPFAQPTVATANNIVSMRARNIPERQLAALRVLFPAGAVSGSDVQTDPRPALAGITAAEEAAAGAYDDERSKLDTARRWWPLTALVLLALATIPVGLLILAIHLRRGREYDVGYHEQYEREPPSDDPPALVTSLVAQREHVGSREFTATLFDLIVRKDVRTLPADNASLAVGARPATDGKLTGFEEKVSDLVGMLESENGGPVELDRMGRVARDADRSTRIALSHKYNAFETAVRRDLRKRRWVDESGQTLRIALAVLLGLAAAGMVILWATTRTPAKPFRDALELAAAGCLGVSCVVAIATPLTVFNRRTREAALLGDRWDAFRRFLDDFPRFADAVPVQIETWERLLVYGIAFGLADRILDEAKLRLPAEALASSSIGSNVWILPWGGDDWAGGLGSSFAPPPSPSSGSGGGFSGGGGGSFGGGGGGAW